MPEPTTSSAAAGVAGWKALGGLAGATAAGAGLAAVVVMCMTTPRTAREWAVGLISTVVCSVAGGAAVVERFGLQAWTISYTGLVALFGLVFACGLPGWAIVRWTFTWMERRRGRDIGEVATEIRRSIAGSEGQGGQA